MGHDEEQEPVDEGFEGEEEPERVILVDEDGNERTCLVLAVIELDGRDFAMLAPEEELADDWEQETTVFFFAADEDEDGALQLKEIEDEATYHEVERVFATLMDLEDGDED